MTDADKLRAELTHMALTQAGAARRWRVSIRTVHRWCAGSQKVPQWVWHITALELGAIEPRTRQLSGDT